jgi:TRAP-type transport system periplasmic protein
MATGRRIILGSILAAPFIRTARANPIALRVSLDTAPNHGRTQAIANFLSKLQAASQGEIEPKLFDSGKLFADSDVIKALVLGQVEMAAPGTWLVSAYVPEADMGQLPLFYGQPAETTHLAIDGIPGDMVNQQVTKKLRVKIPGRWMDLGFTNWYSSHKTLNTLADLKGLKIRNSGGFAQPWRARFFGGVPDMTAWPDVPLALSQGTFDALQSTSESCVSARLWNAGLHFGLVDHQTMGDYIPMIGETFWAALSPALKSLVTDLWAANIEIYRTNLAATQSNAENELKSRGVRLAYVPSDELTEQRKRMLAQQDKVAREMRISPDFLGRINEAIAVTN